MMVMERRGAPLLVPAAILFGCAALATRPAAMTGAVAVMAAVGTLGLVAQSGVASPIAGQQLRRRAARWLAAVAVGVAAFAVARTLSPWAPARPVTLTVLAVIVLASAAEEIFFRRLVDGWFARWGVAAAIAAAAVMFATVHIPAHGVRVLPLDLAAGVLLGWQRWATGGWSAPALTHVVANLLQVR